MSQANCVGGPPYLAINQKLNQIHKPARNKEKKLRCPSALRLISSLNLKNKTRPNTPKQKLTKNINTLAVIRAFFLVFEFGIDRWLTR